MAARKPKVGDKAIIDGEECRITAINEKTTEFKCLERIARDEELVALRALPQDSPEEQALSNAAKQKWIDAMEAKIGDRAERRRLAEHGHTGHGCGGTLTAGRHALVYWVEPAQAWTLNGRLLPRADIVQTHVDDNGVICDDHDENGECIMLVASARRRAKIHRVQGQEYDPLNEVAAHVALNGGAS